MKQYQNFSLIGATQGLRTHKPEANLPTARKIENFYVSRSDGALTLRPDLWRFRDDIYAIGAYLQTSNDNYALNTIITSDTEDRNAFIMSHAPTGIGVGITSNVYDTGTVTTDGTTSVVTGTGTLWKNLIWPGCLIEFEGSLNLYKILGVTSDTAIEVSGTPGALTGVDYKIYRAHDNTRGRYPVHVERYNNQYIYCASSPNAGVKETISGPFTSDGDFINTDTTTTTSTSRTSVVLANVDGVTVPKFLKVAYLNSQWVGINGTNVWTSADRKSWVAKPDLPKATTSIAFGGGYYVFLGPSEAPTYTPNIYRSTNLETWSFIPVPLTTVTSVTPPASITGEAGVLDSVGTFTGFIDCHAADLLYAGSKFVGVGKVNVQGSVVITFHYASAPSVFYTRSVDVFYVRPLIFKSADALTWVSVDAGAAFDGEQFKTISYANSKYISTMVSSFAHSTDAITWTEVAYPAGVAEIKRFAFGAALYVAVGRSFSYHGIIYSSPDLAAWTVRTTPAETLSTLTWYEDLLFDGTNFVAVSGRTVDQSTNGTSWTNRLDLTTDPADHFKTVANSSNLLLVSGALKTYYSDNGTAWTNASVNTVSFKAVASNGPALTARDDSEPDTIVAVGETTLGYVYVSTNGTLFSPVALADTYHRNDILWNGSIFITVGDHGTITTSPDGLHWTAQTSGSTANLYAVTYRSTLGSEMFVAVGAVDTGDAVILTSTDAVTWTLRTSGEATNDLYAVSYGASVYVAGGANGVVYTSANGTAWTQWFTENNTIRKIFYDGSFFYMVGDNDLIGRSVSGSYDPTLIACFTEAGDPLGYPDGWLIAGATTANTTDGYLYWNYTYTPPVVSPPAVSIGTIDLYSDAAKTSLVASGSANDIENLGLQAITLAEQGASGISGTVNINSNAVTTITDASQTVRVHWEYPAGWYAPTVRSLNAFYSNGTYAVIGGTSALLRHVILSEYRNTLLNDDYYGVPSGAVITGATYSHGYGKYYLTSGSTIFTVTDDIGGTTTTIVITSTPGDGWLPLSEIYRGACFTTVDGYVILGNISELESDVWKHYGQRIRWTSPGTYNDFAGEGSGLADLLGLGVGDIVDMRTLGHNVIVFMENGISCLSPTGNIDLPFELRVVAERITAISNPVVMNDSVVFIATDGLLYQVNSVSCTPITSQFDVTEFSDFDPSLVTQLVHDRVLNVLFCYQPDATGVHRVFVINPVTWSVSYFNIPNWVPLGGGNTYYPRAIVQSISSHSIPTQDPQRATLP